jgi:DZF domain
MIDLLVKSKRKAKTFKRKTGV